MSEPTVPVARMSIRAALTDRRFVAHYLQMLAAMFVGMVAFGWLSMSVDAGVEVHCALMATWMNVGMAAWMAWKRHPWASIAEMALAMYLSFAVLIPAYRAGLLDGGGVMLAGHVVMLPAMVVAMLHRREEYAHASAGEARDTA